MLSRLFISLCVVLLTACAVTPTQVSKQQVEKLSALLQHINQQAPSKERTKLSRDVWYKTQELVKDFDLTSPPLWHNTLVNIGLRKKGLCYHWSDTLYLHLLAQNYTHFEFHLAGANIGEYFGEHNALVIVSKRAGNGIEEGIVIDPWRDSGKLYFSKVKEDAKYTWKHRVDRGCR